MKYGVLAVTPVSSETDRSFANLGDMIQAEAILYIYERMNIRNEDIVKIDLKDLHNYQGEYLILPININLSLNWIIDIFPLPDNIIPVFLGLSFFTASKFPDVLAQYFRRYEPIGCRDEFTMRIMRENGIQAFLFGCVTAVFPQRDEEEGREKIFFVDVPQSFREYVSKALPDLDCQVENLSHICGGDEAKELSYLENATRKLLDKYKKEAKLVVTSRLHCMSPCMAMGIPVIPVTDNISPRMGWIDKLLDIYTPETYKDISWSGQKVLYEDVKEKMLDIAIQRIEETRKKYEKMTDLSFFYENRRKSNYGNYYAAVLKKMPDARKESFQYIIWGAGQIGMNAYQVISSMYPNSKLKAVVDSYCVGDFFGIPIEKPDILNADTEEYVFITTTSGEKCAREKLELLGKRELDDYLSMATTAG